MKEWNNSENKKPQPVKPLTPDNYFPSPEGKEKFLPPFTNSADPENSEGKVVPRVCAKCKTVMGTVRAKGTDKSEGICPKCGQGWFWESEATEPGEKK